MIQIDVNYCTVGFLLLEHVISHTRLAPVPSLGIALIGAALSAGRGGLFG